MMGGVRTSVCPCMPALCRMCVCEDVCVGESVWVGVVCVSVCVLGGVCVSECVGV